MAPNSGDYCIWIQWGVFMHGVLNRGLSMYCNNPTELYAKNVFHFTFGTRDNKKNHH